MGKRSSSPRLVETFADITAEFVGKPYDPKGLGPDSYSCLGFVYAFLKRLGKDVDSYLWTFGDLDIRNYHDCWDSDNRIDRKLLYACSNIGIGISPRRVLAGDAVVVENENRRYYPAIYGGCNNIIAAFIRTGVAVAALGNKKAKIVRARRL